MSSLGDHQNRQSEPALSSRAVSPSELDFFNGWLAELSETKEIMALPKSNLNHSKSLLPARAWRAMAPDQSHLQSSRHGRMPISHSFQYLWESHHWFCWDSKIIFPPNAHQIIISRYPFWSLSCDRFGGIQGIHIVSYEAGCGWDLFISFFLIPLSLVGLSWWCCHLFASGTNRIPIYDQWGELVRVEITAELSYRFDPLTKWSEKLNPLIGWSCRILMLVNRSLLYRALPTLIPTTQARSSHSTVLENEMHDALWLVCCSLTNFLHT